jgi:hypothetical protein
VNKSHYDTQKLLNQNLVDLKMTISPNPTTHFLQSQPQSQTKQHLYVITKKKIENISEAESENKQIKLPEGSD